MEFEEILEAECEYGYPVKDIQTFGGIHLIYKVPLEDRGSLLLPEIVKQKSIKNIIFIRGLVISGSEPFRRKHKTKEIVWDNAIQDWKVEWTVWDAETAYPSSVQTGDGILYTSYNLGSVRVDGLREPLPFVRETDIVSRIPRKDMPRVTLTQKALDCSQPYV